MAAVSKSWAWFKGLGWKGKTGVVLGLLFLVGLVSPKQDASTSTSTTTTITAPKATTTTSSPAPTTTTTAAPTTTTVYVAPYVAPGDEDIPALGLSCNDLRYLSSNDLENYREATTGLIRRPAKADRAMQSYYEHQSLISTYC